MPVAGGEEPHQLTKGDHDGAPRWSPDGKFLLFVRATEKDGKPEPPQLSILPMAGGDSFVFTDLPKGASNPVWAPDGKSIAFTSDTNADDLAKQEKKKRKEEELKKAVSAASLLRARHRQPGSADPAAANRTPAEESGGRSRTRERHPGDHPRSLSGRRRGLCRSKAPAAHLGGTGATQRRRKSAAETIDFRPI